MNTFNTRHAIVAVDHSDSFTTLSTYEPKHGRSMRMFLYTDRLCRWLEDSKPGDPAYLEHDCGSFFAMYRTTCETVSIRLTFVTADICDNIHGYVQNFDLNVDALLFAIMTAGKSKILVETAERPQQAEITVTNGASHQIKDMDKLQRRAFSKAMRSCFMWKDTHVCLCRDWGMDFSFVTESLSGGLCLHQSMVMGKDNEFHTRMVYQIHT